MKTAMQELIERLERNIKEMPNEVNTFTQGYKAGLNFVIECATTSLEKEKDQIQKAFSDGQETPINHPTLPHYSREEYYNDNYKP
jgi:hypothetical protein